MNFTLVRLPKREHFKPLSRSSSTYGTTSGSRQSNSCLWLNFPVDAIGGTTGCIPLQSKPVMVDLVYNHLGPEGNYLGDFGPYFTDRYRTPWGCAINYDGPESDEVRAYFI